MKLLSPPLQAFLMIAKMKTVSAAADALHITQTAATQRIKTLEKSLQSTLFIRTRRGMLLTSEGEALLRYCRSFIELEGKALSSIVSTATDSIVTLGIVGPNTIMRTRIIPGCQPVMQTYPKLSMQFQINDQADITKYLRKGDAQIVIIDAAHVTDEMECKTLRAEEYILVAPAKWQTRTLHDIINKERIIDFDAHDQMTFNYLKTYDLFDLARKERHYANRTEALACLIAEGAGYGVLPFEFALPYLKSKQLVSLNDNRTLAHHLVAAWYPRDYAAPYFADVVEALR